MQTTLTVVALIVAAASAGFAAWQLRYVAEQTKALAQQTRTSNALVATSEVRAIMGDLRQVYSSLIEYPELREYLYGGTDGSRLRGKQRARLETVAEMLADTLEAGLFTTRQHPSTASEDDWRHYTRHILTTSPVVRQLVLDHVQWWPLLHVLARAVQDEFTGEHGQQ